MPAYNARLRPKELFGLPLWGVVCGIGALSAGFMALVLPWVLVKVLMAVVGALFFAVMVALFALGEDVAFMPVRFMAARERQRRPAEVTRPE